MDYYESLWKDRVEFLQDCLKYGAIAAVIISTLFTISEGLWKGSSIIGTIGFTLLDALILLPLTAAGACIITGLRCDENNGFVMRMMNSLWGAVVSAFSGSMLGIALGLIVFSVFAIVFLIAAAGYAVYLPVSTLYYFIRYRMEKKNNAGLLDVSPETVRAASNAQTAEEE